VHGYGFHVAVTARPGSAIVPLWAEVTANTTQEAKVAVELGTALPEAVKHVLGDEGYDDPKLRIALERYVDHLLERSLLVPIKTKKRTPGKRRRDADRYRNRRGLYRRRSVSIEPFFDRLEHSSERETPRRKAVASAMVSERW
jgi:hypothetical protein